MSRWLLVVVAFGFACIEVRAADPKPLWEIDTGKDTKRPIVVVWVGFSPDGKTLVAQVEESQLGGAMKARLTAWDVETRKEKFNLDLVQEGSYATLPARANAMTKDGTVLLARNAQREVRLSDGKFVKVSPGVGLAKNAGEPVGVWFNAETGSSTWLLEHADVSYHYSLVNLQLQPLEKELEKPAQFVKGQVGQPFPKATELPLSGFALSPGGKFLAVAESRGFDAEVSHSLNLFAITTVGNELKFKQVASVPSQHLRKAAVSAIQFSPDAKTLATGSYDTSVCLWDVEKASDEWKPLGAIGLANFTVSCLAFSPDGKTLAAGTFDHGSGKDTAKANLWLIDVATRKVVASHRTQWEICSLSYSSDGKFLVTGHSRGGVRVWDAGELLKSK